MAVADPYGCDRGRRTGAIGDVLLLRALSALPPRRYRRCVAMFRLQGSKVLAVDMTGDAVRAKNGSMVA